MAELRHDKKLTIDLDVPLTTQGKHEGGKYDPNSNKTVFYGRMEVDEATADDLLRRQKEFHKYESSLIRDNGVQDTEIHEISGAQA